MKTNEGTLDRALRIVAGLALIGLTLNGNIGVWGWLGVVPLAVGGEGRLVPFPIPSARSEARVPDGADAARLLELDPINRRDRARPLLIGGALTSAAISIAGAAFVAWRLGRPGRTAPMARAARAVREARLTAATALPAIDPAALRRRLD